MLAIIIPYYKISFFEETLKSLENQTDKRFKVYIGDDASPEDPANLLENYQNRFDFVYHRFETNLGSISLTQHWERCTALLVDEEWIMILGDDDILGENVVKSFYENLLNIKSKEINVVRFSTEVIDEKGKVISKKFEHPVLETGQDFLVRKFSKKTRSSLSEYLFKIETIKQKKIKDLPLAWHSDDLAILEISTPNFIYSINNAQLLIRVSSLSITGSSNTNNLKNLATFKFFSILFTQYDLLFTKFQRKVILKKLEMAFFDIPSFKNYNAITSYHFKQIGFSSAIQFQLLLIKYYIILGLKKLKIFNFIYMIHAKIFK